MLYVFSQTNALPRFKLVTEQILAHWHLNKITAIYKRHFKYVFFIEKFCIPFHNSPIYVAQGVIDTYSASVQLILPRSQLTQYWDHFAYFTYIFSTWSELVSSWLGDGPLPQTCICMCHKAAMSKRYSGALITYFLSVTTILYLYTRPIINLSIIWQKSHGACLVSLLSMSMG